MQKLAQKSNVTRTYNNAMRSIKSEIYLFSVNVSALSPSSGNNYKLIYEPESHSHVVRSEGEGTLFKCLDVK